MISHPESISTGHQTVHAVHHGNITYASSFPGQAEATDIRFRHRDFMMHSADMLDSIEHGDRCDCKVLAFAVGYDPKHIDFSYCLNVLQKRWNMDCNHGCRAKSFSMADVSKIHDIGPLDPVKSILISNLTSGRQRGLGQH